MSEHTPLTEAETKYGVQGEWLVEYVNEHTCGTGRDGYYGAHEPGCGMEPVARIADILDALAARTSTATAAAPALPFTVRVPMNRLLLPNDGERLNVGTQHVDVQVILDPAMEKRGECRYGAYGGPIIALREWNEQVYLHELLHAATGYCQPRLEDSHPPEGHDVLSRIEVALWETGWRLSSATADTGLRERVEAVVAMCPEPATTRHQCSTLIAAHDLPHLLGLTGERPTLHEPHCNLWCIRPGDHHLEYGSFAHMHPKALRVECAACAALDATAAPTTDTGARDE